MNTLRRFMYLSMLKLENLCLKEIFAKIVYFVYRSGFSKVILATCVGLLINNQQPIFRQKVDIQCARLSF